MTSAAGSPELPRPVAVPGPRLTRREAEVLVLVVERYRNPEIATMLGISKRTVESYMASLLEKFGATDRSALVALAKTAPAARAGRSHSTAATAGSRGRQLRGGLPVIVRAGELRRRGALLCRQARRHRAISARQVQVARRLVADARDRLDSVPHTARFRALHGTGAESDAST